jgi:hypothetical protein
MIPWIRISDYKETIKSKWTWLLLGLCLATFLAIVIWPKETKKESIKPKEAKKESIKAEEVEKPKNEPLAETPMTQEAGQEGLLPQKWPLEEPEEAETDIIIKIVQGRVTNMDPECTGMVAVDGIGLDAGSLDLTGVRIGDVVEITYKEKKYGSRTVNVVESVEVIGSSQESTRMEIPAEEEPLGEPGEAVGWEEPTEEEPLGEPEGAVEREVPTEEKPSEESEEAETDVPKTMQGRADYEVCTGMFTVNGINFRPGFVDLTGIQTGDIVKITYTKNKYGLVLESLELIEWRH